MKRGPVRLIQELCRWIKCGAGTVMAMERKLWLWQWGSTYFGSCVALQYATGSRVRLSWGRHPSFLPSLACFLSGSLKGKCTTN